jgi:5-hydroxyisourate hydrolase
MGRLSTHVLDTANGRPAAGIGIALFRRNKDAWDMIGSAVTNADGRTDKPLLEGTELTPGHYRLEFHIADYFRQTGETLAEPPFLDRVPIEVGIADASRHYHVPLLCTPWSYSTYRGS